MEHLLEDRKKLVCEEDRVTSDKRLDACQQFTKEVQNKTERISSESKSRIIRFTDRPSLIDYKS